MYRLFSAIYSISFVCLVGVLMTVALVANYDTARPMLGAVVAGAILSLPVAWLVTRKLQAIKQDE